MANDIMGGIRSLWKIWLCCFEGGGGDAIEGVGTPERKYTK